MSEWTEDDSISEYVVDQIDEWENRCRKDRLLRSQHAGCPLVGERFIDGVSHVCSRLVELIMEKQRREMEIIRETNALRAEIAETRRRLEDLTTELERARAFERMVAATAERRPT